MKKNTKNGFMTMIIVFIAALLFFTQLNMPYCALIIILLSICVFALMKFSVNDNTFQILIAQIVTSIICAYWTVVLINKSPIITTPFLNALTLLLAVIVLSFFCSNIPREQKEIVKDQWQLLPQQKYDLQRMTEYIDTFEIIGINGSWGSGKTFLFDYYKNLEDTQQKYIIIKIDLLSCNLEQIHSVIFDSIDRILTEQSIYSNHSKHITTLISNISFLNNFSSVFIPKELTYAEALSKLQQDLDYLDKTILIVYEDIDRISDIDTIKKIFCISEQLVCKKVKIIYQYDESNLDNLGFHREYLEKYIPYTINLTPISLYHFIDHLLNTEYKDNKYISSEDFRFLELPTNMTIGKEMLSLSIDFNNTSIRKVEHYLHELLNLLSTNEEYQNEKHKKIAIIFFIIKHFLPEYYQKFIVGRSLIDSLPIEYNNNSITLTELLHMDQSQYDLHDVANLQHNKYTLWIFSILGYRIDVINDTSKTLNDIYDESAHTLKYQHENEKIDRLIWNLLCNGKSEYTNQENAVKLFISDVLSQPKESQKKAFQDFDTALFNNDLYKYDNQTIYRIGLSRFYSIFLAFDLVTTSSDNWLKLVDFYFDQTNFNNITSELIATLNHCSIDDKAVYLCVLRHFNTLQVIGNMNEQKYYKTFISKYLSALSRLSITTADGIENIAYSKDKQIDLSLLNDILDDTLRRIANLKEKFSNQYSIQEISDDLSIISSFLEKNKEIINHSRAMPEISPHFEFNTRSVLKYQDEYERLLSMKDEPNFQEEIANSYHNGTIGIYEIEKLLKHCSSKEAIHNN